MVKWCGNKAVVIGLTYSSVQSTTTKQRWHAKKKEHCNVNYPDMVKEYNRSMGGVDLNDMLISLDRVDIQTRKWWYLKMITHCVNICNINAWLLYKKFSDQLDVPKNEQRSLLDFTKEVADVLLSAGKGPKEAAGKKRRSSSISVCKSVEKKPIVAKPVADVCFDGYIIGQNLKILEIDAECAQC